MGGGAEGCFEHVLRNARDLGLCGVCGEVQSPKSQVQSHGSFGHATRITLPSSIFYLLSLTLFACSLMSKSMLVTLPFVLLLLDYWPLNRFQKTQAPHRSAPFILRPSSFSKSSPSSPSRWL